ncbi:MAG: hypothetical protein WBH47_17530 [Streptosporangiaceae bacterium]
MPGVDWLFWCNGGDHALTNACLVQWEVQQTGIHADVAACLVQWEVQQTGIHAGVARPRAEGGGGAADLVPFMSGFCLALLIRR